MNHLLAVGAIVAASAAFLAGLLITALTGSARPVKYFLAIIGLIAIAALVAGLVYSHGLLIYLMFQIISLVLVLFLIVILGAVCGGGIHSLLNKKPVGATLTVPELDEYLVAAEFSALEAITEERALARIRSGYYRGGRHKGAWYIHKSELSQAIHKQGVV